MNTRILIIDDVAEARDLIVEMLEIVDPDLATEQAPDGTIGLAMFKRQPFDLVITDLFMPDTEGLETIGELRRISPATKIIAISGGGEDSMIGVDILIAAKRIGADLTLEKPFKVEELKKAIRSLLPD